MSKGPDRAGILRMGGWMVAGTLLQALVGFAAQIVLMRSLSPEIFGRYAIVFAACSIVQTILSLRLNVLIIRIPSDDAYEQKSKRYRCMLFWETAASFLIAAVWLAAAGLLDGLSAIVLVSLTASQWVNQITAFYERGLSYRGIAAVETGSQIFGHAAAVTSMLLGAGGAALYIRDLAAIFSKTAAFARLGALPVPQAALPSWNDLKQTWSEAKSVWFEGLLEGLYGRIVVLSVGRSTGLHGAGLFAQSQRLAVLPHQFLSPATSRMAANLFSRMRSSSKRRRYFWLGAAALSPILCIAAAIAAIWGPEFIPLIFGEHWREAGGVLTAMTGVVVFLTLFDYGRAYLYTEHKNGAVVFARLVQITTFLIWLIVCDNNVESLAWGLSAAQMLGFAAMLPAVLKPSAL